MRKSCIKDLYKQYGRTINTYIKDTFTHIHSSPQVLFLYNAAWGTSPDITVPVKECRLNSEGNISVKYYPRNIINHLRRIGLIQENTHIRSRTIGILTSIISSSLAYRICKGFHSNRAALLIATAGLVAGFGTWFLGTRLFNRTKRSNLAQRTNELLEQTPTEHLFDIDLKVPQVISIANIGEVITLQKLFEHVDKKTLYQMYPYWYEHKKEYQLNQYAQRPAE